MVSIDGYEDVPTENEKALRKAVANQPVSVAIAAGGRDFQLYESVSFSFTCESNNGNISPEIYVQGELDSKFSNFSLQLGYIHREV